MHRVSLQDREKITELERRLDAKNWKLMVSIYGAIISALLAGFSAAVTIGMHFAGAK